ncbi:MAG TPA: FadR/GntR family transcriptional regulator [Vicinamibacteria bacterium]
MSATPSAAPVTHRVVTHLRRLIQRRRLRPGDRLPTERELAQGMGVSRPSVRAALHFLTAMGVIRARQGAGTFIQEGPPSLDSEPLSLLAALHGFTVEEMFEARGALEVNVAGLSAQRATGEQRAVMAEEVASMFTSLGDPSEFLVHDVRFHRAVAGGCNNPVLAALVDMVSALLYERRRDTIKNARDLRQSAEMHRKIYQAIRRGDAATARGAMAEHLRLAQEAWAEEGSRPAAARSGARAAGRRRTGTRRK